MGEDDFVVCFGVFFAGDPFYDWGDGTLWFGWVGCHFGEGEEGEEGGGLYVFGGSVTGLGRFGEVRRSGTVSGTGVTQRFRVRVDKEWRSGWIPIL